MRKGAGHPLRNLTLRILDTCHILLPLLLVASDCRGVFVVATARKTLAHLNFLRILQGVALMVVSEQGSGGNTPRGPLTYPLPVPPRDVNMAGIDLREVVKRIPLCEVLRYIAWRPNSTYGQDQRGGVSDPQKHFPNLPKFLGMR
jgi:hypothetical protein